MICMCGNLFGVFVCSFVVIGVICVDCVIIVSAVVNFDGCMFVIGNIVG